MSWRRNEEQKYGDRSMEDNRRRTPPVWEPRRSPPGRRLDSPARDRQFRDRIDRDKLGRNDRHDRFDRNDRPERFDRNDRNFNRYDRNYDKNDRNFERNDRNADRNDRNFDRNQRFVDRTERFDRNADRFTRDNRYKPQDNDTRERPDFARRRSRSPRCYDDIPQAPSPPHISNEINKSKSRSRSGSIDNQERITVTMADESYEDKVDQDAQHQVTVASPGDWLCKCGYYNFKRRHLCYRHNCNGQKSEGTVYGTEAQVSEGISGTSGITKRLLFRRLDALTTEEQILEAIKERCSKEVLNSVAGITIGREPLTGASKCLAYINFNSISDSSAAYAELTSKSPLVIENRHVLISYYNEPNKHQKPKSSTDYATYYAQYAACQVMAEGDRVNAAAAVAQSAINAAQKRNWTPNAPTFVSSSSQAVQPANIPKGDGITKYQAPDVRTFMYDETSGYYYDPDTGLYYDGNTQYFFNNQTNQYMYWDAESSTYKAATQTHQNTDQPKLPNPPDVSEGNTIKEPEEKKKKDKDDKVKVAKKIAKDMERWAKALNQKKENAKHNIVAEQVFDTSSSKGSADIGFSVLGTVPGPSIPLKTQTREPSPPILAEEFVQQPSEAFDNDENVIDWSKLTCILCKRKFPSAEVLTKHKLMSELHKQNLAEFRKGDAQPQIGNGYRDRAAERRMKFGEDETPVRKRYEGPPTAIPTEIFAPPPSVVDTIGGKMLQKMGWSEGRGLGKEEQGRIAPIEAQQRPGLVGLGQKKGIYTPTPGETYRDTVKKLMIARYKEVVGQEDGD